MISDNSILRALIEQVSKAVHKNKNEQNIRTLISRPMWNAFCRAIEVKENSKPTPWQGKDTLRVYGSETIIIESKDMFSVSFNK